MNCFPGVHQSFTSLLETVSIEYFCYGSEDIEDKPLCTSVKKCRNEQGTFGIHLVSGVSKELELFFLQ